MYKIITTLVLTLSVTVSFTQTFNQAKMDSLLNRLAEKDKAMGSLAIAKNGKIVYTKAVGFASVADKVPATNKTKYRIGSITKMFTGVIIMQLVDEKKISLDENLASQFPGLPNAAKITVGNLLNHHSGIHNFTDDSLYMSYSQSPKTQQELLDIIYKPSPDFEPGSKAAYSNSNYLLLGFLAEKITGKTYAQMVEERITKKLGLKDTYVGGKTDLKNNESLSYKFFAGWQPDTQTDMSIPRAAGALVSTPSDLVTFINALFAGKLMSAAGLEKMKTMQDNYGMAMFQIPFNQKTGYGHNGGIDGFRSVLGYFPADSMAFAYITNGTAYPTNDVVLGALSIFFNVPYMIPTFETVAVSEKQLAAYVGNYASTQMPLKIKVTSDGKALYGQATGQSMFPLEAKGNHVFQFNQAGIVMVFDPAKNEFTLKQGGKVYLYTKE